MRNFNDLQIDTYMTIIIFDIQSHIFFIYYNYYIQQIIKHHADVLKRVPIKHNL